MFFLSLIPKFQLHADAFHRNFNPFFIALDSNYPAYGFRFRKCANDVIVFGLCSLLFSTSDFERADRLYLIRYKIKVLGGGGGHIL